MNKFIRVVTVVAIVTFSLFSVSFSQPSSCNYDKEITFRAKVSDLIGSLRIGKKSDDILSASLPGCVYDPAIEIKVTTKAAANRSTIEKASSSFFSAFKLDDPEWIINNFVIEERDRVRINTIENTFYRRLNKGIMQRVVKKKIIASCRYKNHTLIFACYYDERNKKVLCQVETYRKEEDEWRATNSLLRTAGSDRAFRSYDETMNILSNALDGGQIIASTETYSANSEQVN